METRANYVLVGAFALAGFLGILAFFLWFANLQLDRQFDYYDIDFPTVSGLSDASDVRFAGLLVGRVVDVGLSPTGDGTVRVRIEVGGDTPVRTDSEATIEAQGVTGVAYVGISAGTPSSPLLTERSDQEVPMLQPGQSILQSLSQDAPEIMAETLEVVRELRRILGGENQERVNNILRNVEQSSAAFSEALNDFSGISDTVGTFASEIDRFNTTLATITQDAASMLTAAERTLDGIDRLAEDTRGLVSQGRQTLDRASGAIVSADGYITGQLGPATDQLRETVAEIEARVARFSESAEALMTTYARTGEVATDRLVEAEQTLAAANAAIARVDSTLQSVESAAQGIDTLIADGATPLVAELRVATAEATEVIRTIGATAENDLPEIMADIRGAAASASSVIDTVGADLSSVSGQLDTLAGSAGAALEDARITLRNANDTLAAINGALDTGGRALEAAERAFDGADRVLNEDVDAIVAQLGQTLDTLESAVGSVAAEIPAVAEDLRATSRSAEAAFARIEEAVNASAPAVRAFAVDALPQYGRLATETRALISNLDALTDQIRRNPSRFFLEPRAPEFRR